MPSPFPGMDPWLEDPELFPDFHDAFLAALRLKLNQTLPPGYVARLNRIVKSKPEQRRKPDVSVFAQDDTQTSGMMTATLQGLTTLTEVDWEPATEPEQYLEIRTAIHDRLVTAIELLSLSNKVGSDGRADYLQKQREFLAARVNLVEIDFLRTGNATTMMRHELRVLPQSSIVYHIAVSIPGAKIAVHHARLSLQDRLPIIGLPLDNRVEPIVLDLQELFDEVYDSGRYDTGIDYTHPPTPPLSAEEQTWADELLRSKGVL